MEYNNYYPVQSGHPPLNPQHRGGPQLQQQPQPSGQMMHSPMPQQEIRQPMPPGSSNHHQQMQQMQSQRQQHIGHHSQQQNPNYPQVQPPHSHGPPVSHSSSPHTQQQQQHQHQHQQHHHQQQQHQHQHQHQQQQQQQQHTNQHQHQHLNHNHQTNLPGSLPQQQAMSQNVHSRSPHHHGVPLHIQQQQHQQQQQQQQQQQMNHMARQSSMTNQQPGMQQTVPHHQSFFGPSHMPQSNIHHYPQNSHHPNQNQNHQPAAHHHHQPSVLQHHASPLTPHHPHMHQGIGRNSPYYPNITQTEFRIIEFNRRLQCRPNLRHPYNPLPSPYDESIWWDRFAFDFFEDDATLTLRMLDDKSVEYTIGRTLIPRFFRSYFDGGVTDLSINLRNPKETCIHPHMISLDCDQAFIVTNNIVRHASLATNQSVVVHTEGHLVLDFVSNSFDNLSIKSWKFYTRVSREYIDRTSLTTVGVPNSYLAEPITKHGFTKSTITYLKMCMIMEPMQELMFQHKQNPIQDPRHCLRKLLYERYKFRSGEDCRTSTNKRRKRKPSATPTVTGNTTNKKSKVGIVNSISNSTGINTMIMSPSHTAPSFPLASQDIMVVGEPSMMGGDFGDDNERMITRLENTQYDPTVSMTSNIDENDNPTLTANDEIAINEIESNLEDHTMSPVVDLQHQQDQGQQDQGQQDQQQQTHGQDQHQQISRLQEQSQAQPQQIDPLAETHTSPELQASSKMLSPLNQIDQTSSQNSNSTLLDQEQVSHPMSEHQVKETSQTDMEIKEPDQTGIFEHHQIMTGLNGRVLESQSEVLQSASPNGETGFESQSVPAIIKEEPISQAQDDIVKNELRDEDIHDAQGLAGEVISEASIEANSLNNIVPTQITENHTNSVQNISDEPNSNNQLPCSTPSTNSTIEQQPVDSGVA